MPIPNMGKRNHGSVIPVATLIPRHPSDTAAQLANWPRTFCTIALEAWVVHDPSKPTEGTAYLAKCTQFDESAFAAFFDAYQFQGPERFPPDSLLPGRS
jgi:hypothetical protein